jgi:hypothetical protein
MPTYEAATKEAIERQVFGVPTYVYRDDLSCFADVGFIDPRSTNTRGTPKQEGMRVRHSSGFEQHS